MGALILHLTLLKRHAHHLTQAFHSWHERSVGTKWVWCLMPVRLASAMVQIKYHIFVAKREVCQLYDQLQEVESTVLVPVEFHTQPHAPDGIFRHTEFTGATHVLLANVFKPLWQLATALSPLTGHLVPAGTRPLPLQMGPGMA
ncbi:hypothetical protein DYB34_003577 [Aphanomyces astaci]|uniref:Uncharacterized protein n=1 Tax=Aphanomyces astaci TaxID=112090 RepID=A0A418C242_APHAT|nr:hypothetical protein DYB34_003577 [Aphanomyces astaci]